MYQIHQQFLWRSWAVSALKLPFPRVLHVCLNKNMGQKWFRNRGYLIMQNCLQHFRFLEGVRLVLLTVKSWPWQNSKRTRYSSLPFYHKNIYRQFRFSREKWYFILLGVVRCLSFRECDCRPTGGLYVIKAASGALPSRAAPGTELPLCHVLNSSPASINSLIHTSEKLKKAAFI